MPVKYRSTRGGHHGMSFEDVVLGGLATDKGLYVPESVPAVSADEIESWRSLSFADLAHAILSQYVSTDEIPSDDLRRLLHASYKSFRSPDVTPVVKVGGVWVLELWHGPTFAFKDVALQFLGNLFEFFLERRRARGEQARLTILGATSGDTGSAAIYGMRGKKHMDCFILFPEGRVSQIQERQMTTVEDTNIHCVSVEGSFDDCQAIVKAAFNDKEFRERVSLGAVNSINWARVLAQMTYYFWAYFRVTDQQDTKGAPIHFSVPTGNFGDILAGYYCRRMGLPLGKLLVATNENDILHRFFTSGKYWREANKVTISPSMDICVSSNFERYLFHLAGDDTDVLSQWFADFEKTGKLTIEGDLLAKAQAEFVSASVAAEENLANIKHQWEKNQYLFCPHSSIGAAAPPHCDLPVTETVVLATAHPAKFPSAVGMVVTPMPPAPVELQRLYTLPTRKHQLPNSLAEVQGYMVQVLDGDTALAEAAVVAAESAKEHGMTNGSHGTLVNGKSAGNGSGGSSGGGVSIRQAAVAAAAVAAVAAIVGAVFARRR
ncbi:threonine synthase [Tribonema minus]|uniref:Threonine synthase n=1 Tax=Tribonema minus TaxID=303371 RepID=A0A835Z4E7_9STRA|nr:threonine synthase [Tribonema minus]